MNNFGSPILVVCGSTCRGQEKVPASSLFVRTQSPVPSQHKIFKRVCRRLENTNKAPPRGSSPSRSVTSAWRPLKPFLMSHGSTATNTFKLPEKLSIAWLMPAPSSPPAPPVFHPPLPGAPRRAAAISTGRQPPPLGLMQRLLPILTTLSVALFNASNGFTATSATCLNRSAAFIAVYSVNVSSFFSTLGMFPFV